MIDEFERTRRENMSREHTRIIRRQGGERLVEKFGRDFRNPSLHEICLQIAWAALYASPQPLDENHPQWGEHLAYSEWFRLRVCNHLKLSLDTKWEELQRLTGCLVEEKYPSREDFDKAYKFGENQYLEGDMAAVMWETYEMIKYSITNRL